MANYKVTRRDQSGMTYSRSVEADDCEVYDGACIFTTKVPSSYKDFETNEQVPCERNALVVSFAPGSWLTVEKEGYY